MVYFKKWPPSRFAGRRESRFSTSLKLEGGGRDEVLEKERRRAQGDEGGEERGGVELEVRVGVKVGGGGLDRHCSYKSHIQFKATENTLSVSIQRYRTDAHRQSMKTIVCNY